MLIEVLKLPKLGQTLGPDRTLEIEEYIIKSPGSTIKMLKPVLKQYGLLISGSRVELVGRLRDFANSPEQWTGLFKARVKCKRGDATGARATTHSAKRITELFGDEKENETEYPSKRGPVRRAPRVLHAVEHAQNDAWATLALSCEPRIASQPQQDEHHEHPPLPDTNNTIISDMNMRVRRMERQFSGLNSLQHDMHDKLDSLIFEQRSRSGLISHPPLHLPPIVPIPSGGLGSCVCTPSDLAMQMVSPDQLTSPPTMDSINESNMVTVQLTDGPFIFHPNKAHAPPAQRFSKDITSLFREWESSNLLQINGKGIPVKDWDKIYKKRAGLFQAAWKAIRVKWGNWKFIAEEHVLLGSDDAFWTKYSSLEGAQFGYQQILDSLQRQRQIENKHHAADARSFFKGNLGCAETGGVFSYLKDSVPGVSMKDNAVAKTWKALLADNPSVSEKWSQMQEL